MITASLISFLDPHSIGELAVFESPANTKTNGTIVYSYFITESNMTRRLVQFQQPMTDLISGERHEGHVESRHGCAVAISPHHALYTTATCRFELNVSNFPSLQA